MNIKRLVLIVLAAVFLVGGISAQVVKIATIAPENSPWGEGLKRMASEWSRISNGRVRVNLFFNGIAGSEEESIRKMRIGQLNGLALTSSGMNVLSDAVLTLSSPRLVRNDAELDMLLRDMSGTFEGYLREQNVEVLAWSQGGWIRLFSTLEIRTPDELRQVRLALSPSDQEMNEALGTLGFRGVSVTTNEVLTSLNSGLIDSFLYSPIGAAGFQWFAVAPYMLELEFAPFLGAIIIDSRTWRQIPAQFKEEMLASARRIGEDIGGAIRNLETQAIETMSRYGLQTVSLSADETRLWEEFFQEGAERTLGTVFNEEIYHEAARLLEEFR